MSQCERRILWWYKMDFFIDEHCIEILFNGSFVKTIYARCQLIDNPHAKILMEYKIPTPKYGQTYYELYNLAEVLNVVYRLQDIRSSMDLSVDKDKIQFFYLCQCISGNRYLNDLVFLIDFMR